MLIGNVGRDPEVRYLEGQGAQGATKVATFTLATTERFKDRAGELRENTEWHNIVAWRNSADVAEKYIRKGTQLYVEGKLRTRSWTDATGVKKFTTEIVVDTLQLLGKKEDNPGVGAAPIASAPAAPAAPRQAAPAAAPSYSQPAGFQPRQAPATAPAAAPAAAMDDAGDDLPF